MNRKTKMATCVIIIVMILLCIFALSTRPTKFSQLEGWKGEMSIVIAPMLPDHEMSSSLISNDNVIDIVPTKRVEYYNLNQEWEKIPWSLSGTMEGTIIEKTFTEKHTVLKMKCGIFIRMEGDHTADY